MMQRGHLENTLSVGELEICHLDNVTHGLGDIDDAHQDQDQRHIQGVGQSADRAAQE